MQPSGRRHGGIIFVVAKRSYGTGSLYEKSGAYYGRWRTADGRQLNRKVGPSRPAGSSQGLTRAQAERKFRRMQDAEELRPSPRRTSDTPTVGDVADALRRQLELNGARRSYLQGCESMQRVHLAPRLGPMRITDVRTKHIDALTATLLQAGLAPKTIRNTLNFAHSVFELAIKHGLINDNPVRTAARPGRRRRRDANPDLQFLSVEELDAVVRAIPDHVVVRAPAPTRAGRDGPAPPPPPDVLGPVLRVLVLTAGFTGLRQSELLGLRWRDVDWSAQRVRVRNTFVRNEHSTAGKSDLSTSRSVPLADRAARELERWSRRTAFGGEDELVFAHPQTGRPLDRSKVTKRFKQACSDAAVRPIRFHDLRHTFGTRMAARGVPLRTIQEWLGHEDSETTQIYAHYAPSAHEVALVNDAFAPEPASPLGHKLGHKLSETQTNSEQEVPANGDRGT